MGLRTSAASGGLSWYRRVARIEAREMVARWQRRMLAELERWQLHGSPGG
jgi:hypothetical protein